jgi:hypothetical protein
MPTIKELKARLRSHNAKHCVKISGRKSELQARVTRIGGGVAATSSPKLPPGVTGRSRARKRKMQQPPPPPKRSGLAARMAGGLDRPVQVKPPPKKAKKRTKPNFKQFAAKAPEDQGRRLGKTVSKFENMARMRADKKKMKKWRETLQ